jgi:ribonuclease HI
MHGVDVSFLLIDPYGIRTYFSCHLESECTNNGAKYEALIQGLKKEIDLNIKCIDVFGDSWLVIKQVRNSLFCTSYDLKNYQREVWSMINKFESFNIKSIPHTKNFDTNMLINEASNLNLYDVSIDTKFSTEICRP